MSDEDVIKRRLIFDGDGTGDDRRLNLMLKMLGKIINSADDNSKENQQMYDKLLGQINLCELSRKRSSLLSKSNETQLTKYMELYSEYERKITDIKHEIERQKSELEKSKRVKQNKIMYDLLAKSIDQEPARKDTNEKLTLLQSEIKELNEVRRKYDQKLDQRRKQFHILSTSANMLHEKIENEDKTEQNSMNASLDDITNSPGPEPMSE
ncbi:unnamed protein product [Brassicogethes aeneus]|uniref:Uncharacterized protein n=1 Tax=Brassicogethes aeneus TaxID=1431903 RepID=A0A9P0BG44_BRAAE|nr:unnamed protein product [Brassicogethes aeneus]